MNKNIAIGDLVHWFDSEEGYCSGVVYGFTIDDRILVHGEARPLTEGFIIKIENHNNLEKAIWNLEAI